MSFDYSDVFGNPACSKDGNEIPAGHWYNKLSKDGVTCTSQQCTVLVSLSHDRVYQ